MNCKQHKKNQKTHLYEMVNYGFEASPVFEHVCV